jgi:hypothetical protein
MWVEPDVLEDGADVSRNAGKIALSGADALEQAPIPAAMFGDFDAAHAFHSKLTAGHQSHVQGAHRRDLVRGNGSAQPHRNRQRAGCLTIRSWST